MVFLRAAHALRGACVSGEHNRPLKSITQLVTVLLTPPNCLSLPLPLWHVLVTPPNNAAATAHPEQARKHAKVHAAAACPDAHRPFTALQRHVARPSCNNRRSAQLSSVQLLHRDGVGACPTSPGVEQWSILARSLWQAGPSAPVSAVCSLAQRTPHKFEKLIAFAILSVHATEHANAKQASMTWRSTSQEVVYRHYGVTAAAAGWWPAMCGAPLSKPTESVRRSYHEDAGSLLTALPR